MSNAKLDTMIAQFGKTESAVIPILQAIQSEFQYLPADALEYIAQQTDISLERIYGVSTFYSQFRHEPMGKHLIKVCVGTACHVKGAIRVYDAFKRELAIGDETDTDSNGLFTVDKVACLGCCTIAPVVQIDQTTFGHVEPAGVKEIIEQFLLSAENPASQPLVSTANNGSGQTEIRIGLGSCCVASGSSDVKAELEKSLHEGHIQADVKQVGCVGICNQVPLLEIHQPNLAPVFYTKVKPDEVKSIVRKHFKPKSPWSKLKNNLSMLVDNIIWQDFPQSTNKYLQGEAESPVDEFLLGQINIATENRGFLQPTNLQEYRDMGGFQALEKCLRDFSPREIVDILKDSGLRGRGGGGFPTWKKWEQVQNSPEPLKYVICNGDEGDPGAFMDRMLLESYPFRVIEGVLIAAYATGAREGLFYIRAEYPLAVKRINEALYLCQKANLLGGKILGFDFSFNLKIFEGAGAFICGEETALIASVEGKRGIPSQRPPYPSVMGLHQKPTLINNTETFALVPYILRHGAKTFNSIGTSNSKGSKVFALAGKINRGGLIEVPLGITIHEIVHRIGGGIPWGKAFKAVQIGGPSGGCIPAHLAHMPVDFESLAEIGSMMGSGGLVVLDEDDCMVDIARYFLSFTQDQSCGKCTFCRVGTTQMLQILNKISSGKGTNEDLITLEKLAHSTKKGSLCGLGKTAPNPVLSTLQYFRHEYLEHINGKCKTGKCKDMVRYEIDETCIGCTKCAVDCPVQAIEFKPWEQHFIDQNLCIKCDICRQICPTKSVITL